MGDAHHHTSVPSLLPVSTDVSCGSSPTRFGGDDSPAPREAFLPPDFGHGPLHASANSGGGFGSPFTGGLPPDSRAFSAGFPSFSGLAAPMGPRVNGLHTLSAPLNALPQVRSLCQTYLRWAMCLCRCGSLTLVCICPKRSHFHTHRGHGTYTPSHVLSVEVCCPVHLRPGSNKVYVLPQGMVPVDQPGSGFLSHPVHLRDTGRAFSMPAPVTGGACVAGERHGHALPLWQPLIGLDNPSRRRAKRPVRDANHDGWSRCRLHPSAPSTGLGSVCASVLPG